MDEIKVDLSNEDWHVLCRIAAALETISGRLLVAVHILEEQVQGNHKD